MMTCVRRSYFFLAVVFPRADDLPPCRTGVHFPIFPFSFRPPSPRSKAKAMSKYSQNRQGGNNFSCRVTVLIFTILAIGCAACANIFPVFKKESNTKKVKQTLWYSQTTVSGGVGTKVDVSESLCGQYKLFFQVSEGAAVAAAGIGLVVLGLAIAQLILEEKSSRFTCCAASLISLAFAACGACVALIVYGYMRGYCQSDAVLSPQYGPFKDQGYKFSEAFYLICAACGLFLLSSFFQCCA
ncbi:hypothetical protein, conserved [Trypanosoma cruzi]|uniref:Amastin n=1 Tax=Trypanosoma cruzi (strain CL Brener) TaxID=353153 RepID=Q4CVW7_TRYCC|nr:hypothetical protein, conserved [Trypanosoma cruzi]EAN84422.1 hypothetical protein, conserved [Trypanosoma cruzi]|eukprot:XP_806273.1 hypothetical protein [Trypanosoma cruzi strain CL Brener]